MVKFHGSTQRSNLPTRGYPITKRSTDNQADKLWNSVYYSSSLSRDPLGYARLVINTTLG